MRAFRTAILAAGSLLLTGMAASAAPLLLVDAGGAPVAVLEPVAPEMGVAAAVDPFAAFDALFAAQDAQLRQMLMQVQQLQQAAFAPPAMAGAAPALVWLPPGAAGRMVLTIVRANGRQSCTQTISYGRDGDGAPRIEIRDQGAACQAMDAPARAAQSVAPDDRGISHDQAGRTYYQIDDRRPVSLPQPSRL